MWPAHTHLLDFGFNQLVFGHHVLKKRYLELVRTTKKSVMQWKGKGGSITGIKMYFTLFFGVCFIPIAGRLRDAWDTNWQWFEHFISLCIRTPPSVCLPSFFCYAWDQSSASPETVSGTVFSISWKNRNVTMVINLVVRRWHSRIRFCLRSFPE